MTPNLDSSGLNKTNSSFKLIPLSNSTYTNLTNLNREKKSSYLYPQDRQGTTNQ